MERIASNLQCSTTPTTYFATAVGLPLQHSCKLQERKRVSWTYFFLPLTRADTIKTVEAIELYHCWYHNRVLETSMHEERYSYRLLLRYSSSRVINVVAPSPTYPHTLLFCATDCYGLLDRKCKPNARGVASASGAAPAGGNGSGSYHLDLVFETPGDDTQEVSSSAFDFVCSSSGLEGEGGRDGRGHEEAVGFDRVCALRGKVVHIFTMYHQSDDVAGKGTSEWSMEKNSSVGGKKGGACH